MVFISIEYFIETGYQSEYIIISEKKIDLSEVDFKKLKVKDLKKILSDWDQDQACKGCSEKSDFVRAVKELMPKHAPEAYKKLKEREEL